MWKFCLTPKYGALRIPITQWRDTAAKVSANALPRRLELAALALGCKFQKDMEGSRLMRALCTTTGPIPEDKLSRLLRYCENDVETERDIDRRLPDLCPGEQRVWFMDQYINDTGIRIDTDAVHKAVKLIEEETKNLNDELYRLTGGLVNAGTQRAAIKNYLESKGVKLPDLTKATVKEAVTKAGGDNLRILQLRQQLSLTSNAKYAALAAAVSEDERIRDTLVYHGASTGRWSGKLVQIQNLVKATLSPQDVTQAIETLKRYPSSFNVFYDVLPTLSSCIRGMFIPSKAHEMFITDFSAIEARVVMWLAGENGGLDLFRSQDADPEIPDIYVHMARAIHNKNTLTKADKKARQLGKQTVLGCGFGMGVKKFIETCAKYEIEVTDELAERAVMQYRKVFAKVPHFWYAMEDAAKKTIVSGKPHTCGHISWLMDGNFLRMRLPSGRTLAYHHPKVTVEGKITFMAVNSVTNKYEVEETWGGKLVENATQAVARDIMVEAMFKLIGAEYKILFTIHDELVVEHGTGKGSIENVLRHVKLPITWAADCPINAECIKTQRYQK
jgi:DNA polymerase